MWIRIKKILQFTQGWYIVYKNNSIYYVLHMFVVKEGNDLFLFVNNNYAISYLV